MSYLRLLRKEDHEIDLYRFEKQGIWVFPFFLFNTQKCYIHYLIIHKFF